MEIAHCSTVPDNEKNQHMIPFPYNHAETRHVLGSHCLVSVTGLLRRLQVKIGNIYFFKIIIKTCRRLSKLVLPKFSRAAPKNLSCPKFGGGCSPPRPPGPYAYVYSGDGFSRAPPGGTGFHGKIFLKASKKIT